MEIVKLNLARNCIKYLIREYGIKEIFVPYYICKTVWGAIREEKCKVNFYHIDKNFMPVCNFLKTDFVLYPNYYGLCSGNCKTLEVLYPNLIVDNTQSFYSEHVGFASFNSLRKFFPVQNGAYLYTSRSSDKNFNTDNNIYKYICPQDDYEMFVKNELLLNMEKEIKYILPEVENFMQYFDFEKDKCQRIEMFKKYSEKYNRHNKIIFNLKEGDIPYCYPFSPANETIKSKILSCGIPLIKLWRNFPEKFPEYEFINDVVALPLNEYSERIFCQEI